MRKKWHHINHAKRMGWLDQLFADAGIFVDYGYQFDAHVLAYRWHTHMLEYMERRWWERY